MRFWDSSAIVPLLLIEATSDAVLEELDRDSAVIIWWGTRVECASAVARRERDGRLTPAETMAAMEPAV